jgi:hypothetical protein
MLPIVEGYISDMLYSISILLGTVYDSRQAPVAPIIPERWSAHQPPRLAASRSPDLPRPHTDIAPEHGACSQRVRVGDTPAPSRAVVTVDFITDIPHAHP